MHLQFAVANKDNIKVIFGELDNELDWLLGSPHSLLAGYIHTVGVLVNVEGAGYMAEIRLFVQTLCIWPVYGLRHGVVFC